MSREKLPRPVFNRLIVKPLPQDEKSVGGIFIPGTVKEVMEEATVIHSSSEVIKDGEVAVYPSHLGVEIMHKGEKHKWLNDSEVWGVNDEE